MTVQDLIDMLTGLVEDYGEDWAETCPVTMAYQPSYPLESAISGVTEVADGDGGYYDKNFIGPPSKLVVCEGGHIGYGQGWWWEHCS